jgi:hypothetical protein
MSATVIRLRQRSDPAFRAMAEDLIAIWLREGVEASLAEYRRRLEKGSRRFRLQLSQAVHALIEEASDGPDEDDNVGML